MLNISVASDVARPTGVTNSTHFTQTRKFHNSSTPICLICPHIMTKQRRVQWGSSWLFDKLLVFVPKTKLSLLNWNLNVLSKQWDKHLRWGWTTIERGKNNRQFVSVISQYASIQLWCLIVCIFWKKRKTQLKCICNTFYCTVQYDKHSRGGPTLEHGRTWSTSA